MVKSIKDTLKGQIPGNVNVTSDEQHLQAAVNWIDRSQRVTGSNGSAATYNLFLGWEPAYPETTGYIIPTLFDYAEAAGSERAQTGAIEMAEWLLSVQHPNGSFPSGTGISGDPNAFNTGQILLGLVAAFERTSEPRYERAIRKACEWLVDAQHVEGHWEDVDYNTAPHSYSSRIAWPMLVASEVFDGPTQHFREAAESTLNWVVENRLENGWFEYSGFEPGEDAYLHTIAYTIRGLLEGGLLLEDDTVFTAGKRTADVLLEIHSEEGPLKGSYDSSWEGSWYYCLTGNAQMAINWLVLFDHTGNRRYLWAARNEIQFLKRHQLLDAHPNVRGGLAGSYPIVGKYIPLRYPNWAAKFFADALLLISDASEEAPSDRTASKEPDETDDDSVRVCLLFDGEYTSRWVAEAIEEMVTETNAEITLVVINDDSGVLGSGNVIRGAKYPAYAAFWLISNQLNRFRKEQRYDDSIHISEIPEVGDQEWIRTHPANVDGLWNEIPDEVVDEIRSRSDVVFRRGFGLISGEVLSAAEYGVLSYHHGDPRKYRGGPAGFWEFMHGEKRGGMMVQSLTDELDAGIIQAYDEIDISNCRSWGEIRQELYNESTGLLSEAIRTVQDTGAEPMVVEDLGEVYHPPSSRSLLDYIFKNIKR